MRKLPGALAMFLSVLAGCARPVSVIRWDRADTSDRQFYADRYDCLKQATQRMAKVDAAFGGVSASERDVVNWGMFTACMSAIGYSFNPKGRFGPPGAPTRF